MENSCEIYLFPAMINACDSSIFSRFITHDDVIKWRYFWRNFPFVQGSYRSPLNSSHKGPWRGALIFPLICAWINGWVNNRESGDSGRHNNHYEVTAMATAPLLYLSEENELVFHDLKNKEQGGIYIQQTKYPRHWNQLSLAIFAWYGN